MATSDTVDVVKCKFRQLDQCGTGSIKASVFCEVLSELGLPDSLTHDVVGRFCDDLSNNIQYNQFLDLIFLPAAHGSECSQLEPAPILNHLSSGTTCVENQVASSPAPLQSVHRVLRTLVKGRLRNAAHPLEALAEFCREAAVSSEIQNRMHTTFDAVLQDGVDAHVEPLAEEEAIWKRFARWCVGQLLVEVFEVADLSDSGLLSMQDLMVLLMLLAVQREMGGGISPQDAEQIVREFDSNSDGRLSKEEFLNMVCHLERENDIWMDSDYLKPSRRLSCGVGYDPHLVLNFDVNNTVLIKDSVTSSDAYKLISTALAGSCWGVKRAQRNSAGGHLTWVLVDHKPSGHPPWEGLSNYAQYVQEQFPFVEGASLTEVQAVKKQQRTALQTFCEPGQPGEGMRPHLDKVLDLLNESSTKLLPSFYYLLYHLKRAGRSFSVAFRTFGIDVNKSVQLEFNDFCEGRCPHFDMNGIVLDGSDGDVDLRMDLSDRSRIGTFYRKGDLISLLWGTNKQPPETEAGQALGLNFYDDIEGITAHVGVEAAASSLKSMLVDKSRTVVIRDFYPGWAEKRFDSTGGKPIFLNIEDDSVFQIFFDDHAQPESPGIVDVIDVREYPKRVPMPQVYDIHMVKAMPLRSIGEISYFLDELHRCEMLKTVQLMRRKKVARMLHDVEAIRRSIVLLGGEADHDDDEMTMAQVSSLKSSWSEVAHLQSGVQYTTWSELGAVKATAPLPPDATDMPILTHEESVLSIKSSGRPGRSSHWWKDCGGE